MARATPKRAGRKPAPGSRFPSEVVAANVRVYRLARVLTQDQLGERMAALGHEWTGGIVGFVERGERTVTVDELAGLAVVLGETIGALLDPAGMTGQDNPNLDLGAGLVVKGSLARLWAASDAAYKLMWDGGPRDLGVSPKTKEAWEAWRAAGERWLAEETKPARRSRGKRPRPGGPEGGAMA